MIKINLVKSKIKVEGASEEGDIKTFEADSGDIDQKELAIKMALILAFPVLFYFYDRHETNKAKSELAAVSRQVSQLQTELNQKRTEVEQLAGMDEEVVFLQSRLDALADLSKLRMRELRALDFIQSIIPRRVWLTRLQIKDAKVELEGAAVGDTDLNQLMNRMEGSVQFRSVVLLKAEDSTGPQGAFKAFEVSAEIGEAP